MDRYGGGGVGAGTDRAATLSEPGHFSGIRGHAGATPTGGGDVGFGFGSGADHAGAHDGGVVLRGIAQTTAQVAQKSCGGDPGSVFFDHDGAVRCKGSFAFAVIADRWQFGLVVTGETATGLSPR